MEKSDAGQAVRAGAVDKGMRSVDHSRTLVVQAGMPADALDGLTRGQFSCEKTLHAPADEEVFFVLQVQACQDVQVVLGAFAHVSMVTIGAAMSMAISRAYSDICDWGNPGYRERACAPSKGVALGGWRFGGQGIEIAYTRLWTAQRFQDASSRDGKSRSLCAAGPSATSIRSPRMAMSTSRSLGISQ